MMMDCFGECMQQFGDQFGVEIGNLLVEVVVFELGEQWQWYDYVDVVVCGIGFELVGEVEYLVVLCLLCWEFVLICVFFVVDQVVFVYYEQFWCCGYGFVLLGFE